MPELTGEEVSEWLHGEHTIFAPDGTRFVVKMAFDPTTEEQLFDTGLLRYEVCGPVDRGDHLWLADYTGDLVPNPTDEDVPKSWTVLAKIALQGWLQMREELTP